jgi:hypothetical protein
MQIEIENRTLEQSFSFRASKSHCPVTLPHVDPLSGFLEGQKVLLKGRAKRLLGSPLPPINSVNLHYKTISAVLIEAIECGALKENDVKNIINSFSDKTSARNVIHSVNVKIRNHAIADELNLIKNNAVDIYSKVHLLGYNTDNLDVADLTYEDNTLFLEFCNPIKFYSIDDRNMPYEVQLCVAAVARYFGTLCSISPSDHFVNYSEDFESINEVDANSKKMLLSIDNSLLDNDYINAFKKAMPTKQFNEYVKTLEDYYEYFFEDEEQHLDIVNMIKESINRLAFINADQFNIQNHYPIKSSQKLLSRVNKLNKKFKNNALSLLINALVNIMQIAHDTKNLSKHDFDFDGEVFDLSYHQALTFKSIESDFMWSEFSESEKHIMETGDYAKLIMDISSESFMNVFRNHQLGWLLQHCLSESIKEFQNNV